MTGNTWAIEGKKFKTAYQKGAIGALRYNTSNEWFNSLKIFIDITHMIMRVMFADR